MSAIVNLGGVLGLGVTAEGVEDASQLARLRELGCQQAQGYFFAKPMSGSDLEGFLAAGVRMALADPSPRGPRTAPLGPGVRSLRRQRSDGGGRLELPRPRSPCFGASTSARL